MLDIVYLVHVKRSFDIVPWERWDSVLCVFVCVYVCVSKSVCFRILDLSER